MSGADYVLFNKWTRGHDAEAFKTLCHKYAGMVYATCLRILRNAADAEDAAQDCFETLARQARGPKGPFGPWLHRVATNRALDHLKSGERRRRREEEFAKEGDAALEPVWDDIYKHVDQAIAELPEKLRVAIVAHFIEDQTHEAIAQQEGVSRSAVTRRVQRGIEQVRKTLRRRGMLVSAGALGTAMSAHLAEAVPLPSRLARSIGKLALAGPSTGGVLAAAVGTGAMWGPVIVGVLAACSLAALSGGLVLWHSEDPQPEPAYTAQVASVTQTSSDATSPAAPESVAPPTADVPSEPMASDEAEEPLAEGGFATLSGTVKDDQGRPVADADVLLVDTAEIDTAFSLDAGYVRPASAMRTTSDERGEYHFAAIPFDGSALASAAHRDWACKYSKTVSLAFGQDTKGVDLELVPGKALSGRVLSAGGVPVANALVVTQHAWNRRGYTRSRGYTLTDAAGRFTLFFGLDADWCTLRVSSAEYGQSFFVNLSTSEKNAQLRMQSTATLRGRVTWQGGRPAQGVVVSVCGSLPEPQMSTQYSGGRPEAGFEAEVDAEGNYEIAGIMPALEYRGNIVQKDADNPLKKAPLTAINKRLEFKPGEVTVWNAVISGTITFQGVVRTQKTGSPAPGVWIHVLKDGQHTLHGFGRETDKNGEFKIELGTGPGRYDVFAGPFHTLDAGYSQEYISRFGKRITLRGGESVDPELKVFEPISLPVRVVNSRGEAVESVQTTLRVVTLDGEKKAFGSPRRLDDDGRTVFLVYWPVTEFWLELKPFPPTADSPVTTSRHFSASLGDVLPEETFVLDDLCGLTGVLLRPDGTAFSRTSLSIEVEYDDGAYEVVNVRTDEQGLFEKADCLRARPIILRLHRGDAYEPVTFESVTGVPGELIDLGEVVLEPRASEQP